MILNDYNDDDDDDDDCTIRDSKIKSIYKFLIL